MTALIAVTTIFGFGMFGCGDGSSGVNGNQPEPQKSFDKIGTSAAKYKYGVGSAITYNPEKAWSDLKGLYDQWKEFYVTSDGADGYLRVRRDYISATGIGATMNFDTVSEGIGYGMLLAVYFDDKETFDALWAYSQIHNVNSEYKKYDPINKPYCGLMHWKVNSDGKNIDEFGFEVGVTKTKLAYVNINDVINKVDEELKDYKQSASPMEGYLPAHSQARTPNSAVDADFDMAAALVIAYKRWGSYNGHNYGYIATQMIKDVLTSCIEDNWIKAGSTWGGKASYNPSYFAPAWLHMFQDFLSTDGSTITTPTDSRALTDVNITKFNKQIEAVLNLNYNALYQLSFYEGRNHQVGYLFPDWCCFAKPNSIGGPIPDVNGYLLNYTNEAGDCLDLKASDRVFYEDVYDELLAKNNGNETLAKKDLETSSGRRQQSFNYYYDAVRVPWRLSVDYSWYGPEKANKAGLMTRNITYKYQKQNGGLKNVVDGYTIFGDAWDRENRDGFNNLTTDGGVNAGSTTFIAMHACAAMTQVNDSSWAQEGFTETMKKNDYKGEPGDNEKYHYFGNTLRMLSLLYLSGNMCNPYED